MCTMLQEFTQIDVSEGYDSPINEMIQIEKNSNLC